MTVLAFVGALSSTACHPNPAADLRIPPEVVVVRDAFDVRPEHKTDGSTTVAYRVHEAFPADTVLQSIRAALPATKWDAVPMDWMNPDVPSSHQRGWTSWTDGTKTPPTWVHQWSAQWRDKQGNIVYYELRYDSVLTPDKRPDDLLKRPDNDVLRVTGAWVPREAADRLMSWGASQSRQPRTEPAPDCIPSTSLKVQPRKVAGRQPDLTDLRGVQTHAGVLVFEITVLPSGRVGNVRLVTEIDPTQPWPAIAERWRSAIAEWRYDPGIVNNKPAAACITVTVNVHVQ